jgi:hypothetical protein
MGARTEPDDADRRSREPHFTWADWLFLLLGLACALYGASRAAKVDEGHWTSWPYYTALSTGLLVAGIWSWFTWFRGEPPRRSPRTERRRRRVMGIAPFLGVLGFLLIGTSDAVAAITFALMGGFLIATLGVFGLFRLHRRR